MSNITALLNRQQYQRTAARYLTPKEGSIEAEVRRQVKNEVYGGGKVNQAKSYWYNPATDYDLIEKSAEGNRPEPQSIYWGDDGSGHIRPTWEIKCFDYGSYSSYLKSQDASTDSRASRFDSLVGVFGPEIQESAYNYLRSKEAGVITSGDFSNIQLLADYIDIMDIQQRQFSIINSVTTKATNVLSVKTLAYSRFGITEEIGELEAPEGRKGQFSTQTFSLKKFGGLIAYSDEAQMQNWSGGINPIDYSTQNLSNDAVRIKAKKIAASLASLTTASTTVGDWSGYTTDHSTVNPLKNFQDIFNEIYANYGQANVICSTPRTYTFFTSNTNVTAQTQAPANMALLPGEVPAKGLPGIQWFVDNSLPENYIYVFDKRGVWYLSGPSRIATFREEQTGTTGVIYREWGNSFVKETGFGKKATGIAP